jgi:hypothetical protein
VATVAVLAGLGAGGLVYQAGVGPATARAGAPAAKPASELEALRKENELLKLNLQVVLEKVRAQEAEIRTLKGQAWATSARWRLERLRSERDLAPLTEARGTVARELLFRALLSQAVKKAKPADPLKEAEAALKALREARDDAAKRRAAEALEKAIKQLREQLKAPARPGK